MNILSNAIVLGGRQVIVDDVLDVGDIKATSSDAGSDKNGATSGTE